MQSGIKDKKRAEETAQVYRAIAKKEQRHHRYVVRPFRYSDTASRMRKNPLTRAEAAKVARLGRLGHQIRTTQTGAGRSYGEGVGHAVYRVAEIAGGKHRRTIQRAAHGGFRTERFAANRSRRKKVARNPHAGLKGLMSNSDAKRAMRFA